MISYVLYQQVSMRFSCGECPDRFKSKAQLIAHRRAHTGERTFTCQTCSTDFTQAGSLRRHQAGCRGTVKTNKRKVPIQKKINRRKVPNQKKTKKRKVTIQKKTTKRKVTIQKDRSDSFKSETSAKDVIVENGSSKDVLTCSVCGNSP